MALTVIGALVVAFVVAAVLATPILVIYAVTDGLIGTAEGDE